MAEFGYGAANGKSDMNDTPEVVQPQVAEATPQLSRELASLEHRFSETVQATRSAVNATVGSVQDAVQSVSNAFDLKQQMEKHPWLILGGAVAVGYLAAEFLDGPAKPSGARPSPDSSNNHSIHRNGKRLCDSLTANRARLSTQIESSAGSPWYQLRTATVSALVGLVNSVAARVSR